MDSDITKERIGILKNEMNQLWSAILATFGGSIVLLIKTVLYISTLE